MDTVGVYEAGTHLTKLLDRVAKGDRVTITRHGVPVAVLSPVGSSSQTEAEAAIAAMLESGRGRTTGGVSIREMIEEGRRY